MNRLSKIPDSLPVESYFPVEVDLTTTLGAENITSATFTSADENGVTASVLDLTKCNHTSKKIKFWLKCSNGTSDTKYAAKAVYTTDATDPVTDAVAVSFKVKNLI